jgi:hypothetical protein
MSGWVAYHKLPRQQLLTLAIALEEQRDRALTRLADVWDEALVAGEHHFRELNPSEIPNPYRSGT